MALLIYIMLRNPFFIEISRPAGTCRTLEIIPVYEQRGDSFVATRNFRIYAGYEPDALQSIDGDTLREQYLENLELMGKDNPCFLGELQFNGFAYFEWRYLGDRLNGKEVWQIVDLLQNCVRTYLD
jgi:hypothetical protein